jgi:hypothetical protein
LVQGGGAGAAPATITTGTGVVTALGVNTGTAGAFVVNGGALGTPSSGTVTNLTGTASININGTVGATTPAAVTATTIAGTDTTDASNTTTAALKTAGGLAVVKKIYVGDNVVQGTAAKGFDFSANTPLAGKTSTILNWYEEGTYVATLTPATSGTIPLNSSYDTLSYTKIGRLVTVIGQIQTLNPVLPVGSNFALNLPFTPVDLPELAGRGGVVINYEYTSVPATWEEGTANLYIWKNAATVSSLQNLFLSFTYFAA